jgi:hypothetical protein
LERKGKLMEENDGIENEKRLLEIRTRKGIIEIRTGKGIGEITGKSDGRERRDRE